MTLVKTSKIRPGPPAAKAPAKTAMPRTTRKPAATNGHAIATPGDLAQKIAERIAAATEQLAAGLTQSASAAAELRRAMEQMASGAQAAAVTAQNQLESVKTIGANLEIARGEATGSERRTATVQIALAEAAGQITATVRAIEQNTQRQQASIAVIAELKRRANDIGDIAQTVSRVADQTNLLALNAAIEAARAGDHGKGFAVVAEEVRSLAEISDRSAQKVQGFTQAIQADVLRIVEAVGAAATHAETEARAGATIVETLETMRLDMAKLAEMAQSILISSVEMARATVETQRGAEQVASAAREQSTAADAARQAIQEQEKSFDQGQTAARSLASLADGLRAGAGGGAAQSAAHRIGGATEQLSATLQEMSGAAAQIMVAVDQINHGSQLQASAAQQTSRALGLIEKSADAARIRAGGSAEQVRCMRALLERNRNAVASLAAAVVSSMHQTTTSLEMISGLDALVQRIGNVVERISLVAVQTTMLAVSGAVEAARAGDAGRGFAVVSGDIRGLAREATDRTDQVRDTVRNMSDQLGLVRRNLEHIVESAAAEAEKNYVVIAALDRVGTDLSALEQATGTILAGTKTVSDAIAETAGGARKIAGAADQSNVASREAAIAASELARTAEDLAAAIEEIASLAEELQLPNG